MNDKDLKIHFRYLTENIACLSVDSINGKSVHNDINNEEAIIIYNSLVGEKENCQTVKTLLEENEKLKKQLEELEESSAKAINKQVSKGIDLINQQQEFIEYMEKCIKELEKESLNKLQNVLNLGISDIAKEILQKYKEIIGNDINVDSKGE